MRRTCRRYDKASATINGIYRGVQFELWIQMNFYSNPSGITQPKPFQLLVAFKKTSKNPLFEAISPRGPMGRSLISSFQKSSTEILDVGASFQLLADQLVDKVKPGSINVEYFIDFVIISREFRHILQVDLGTRSRDSYYPRSRWYARTVHYMDIVIPRWCKVGIEWSCYRNAA